MSSDVVECKHCHGTGSCNCDACWKANRLNPDYSPFPGFKWTRDSVPCKVCGGTGKLRVR